MRPRPDEAVERSWRDGVSAWVLAMRDAYRAHPWLVDIPISGAPITPNSLTMVDWFLREVRDLPLSDGEKMSALLLVTSYARATSAQERDLGAAAAASDPGGRHAARTSSSALVELVTPERFPYLSPLLTAGGYIAEPGAGSLDERRRLRVRPAAHPRRDRVPRRPRGSRARRGAPPPPAAAASTLPRDQRCARRRRPGARPRRRSGRRRSASARPSSTRSNASGTTASSRTRARRTGTARTGAPRTRTGATRATNANGSTARMRSGRMPRLSAARSSPGRAP